MTDETIEPSLAESRLPFDAMHALRVGQRQLDEDGVEIGVSR